MHRKLVLFTSILILLIGSIKAQSNAIVIEALFESTKKCSSDSTKNRITYTIRKDIMRLDIKGPLVNSSIVFQPASNKIWVMYHHEKVYYSMDRQEMRVLDEQVIKEAEEFKKAFDAMDSASQLQTSMLWPDGNPFMFDDPDYEFLGKKDTLISQMFCSKYHGKLNNGNDQYVYINDFKRLGLKREELEILNTFNEFMGLGVKALSGNMDFANIYFKENLKGYPVLIQNWFGDTVCNYYWLQFIYRDKVDNQFFEIPLPYGKFENPLGNK